MNKKTLISTVASAALVGIIFSGCGEEAPQSIETNTTTQLDTNVFHVKAPKGSVTGLVQDTNGNPLSGMEVYLAGQSTTTDAGGIYHFAEVAVTNVSDLANNTSQVLSISIVPTSEYVGATVTVTAQAQLSNAEGGSTAGVETFIEGFIASAGTAVLPAKDSTVSGVLRDATSGAALANETINFEFVSGGTTGTAQEQAQNGVNTTYAVNNISVSTDINGNFSFASLPTDSNFTVSVEGYITNSINNVNTTSFTSYDEPKITLGSVAATKIVSNDTIAPFVTSVTNASDATRATLDDDTNQVFVINFSEPLDATKFETAAGTNSIVVVSGQEENKQTNVSFTSTISGNQITVTTASALPAGDLLDIIMLRSDVQDTSGNLLTANVAGTTIAYDDNNYSDYLRLKLKIYSPTNTGSNTLTTASQMSEDTTGTDDKAALVSTSSVFTDVLDESTGFEQLNSQDDNTSGRLSALASALDGSAVTVKTDATRIKFTGIDAAYYIVSVTDKKGNPKAQADIIGATGTTTSTNVTLNTAGQDFTSGLTNEVAIKVPGTEVAEVYLSNVAPTDIVNIMPVNGLGYFSTPATITLTDNVAPTTILQKSYFAGDQTSDDNGTNNKVFFGAGGELSYENGGQVIGTPYLVVNNSLLDNLDGNGANVSNGATRDNDLKKELYAFDVNDTTGTGKPFLDGQSIYDAQAASTYKGTSSINMERAIGVAFSENLASAVTPTFTGATSVIKSVALINDLTSNIDGNTTKSDLIAVTVDDVMTLANTDNGLTLDFSGVSDVTGNVASSSTNAKVVIKDEMAPLVEKALYQDGSVQITFNENITLFDDNVTDSHVQTKVTITGSGTATAVYTANSNWTVSGKTLTIPYTDFTSNVINDDSFWNLASYGYSDSNLYSVTSTLKHATLDFTDVSDTLGNSWNTYATKAGSRAVATPKFAMIKNTSGFANSLPDSTTNTNFTASTSDTANQTVIWTFDDPVHVGDNNVTDLFATADFDSASNTYKITDFTRIPVWFEAIKDPSGTPTSDALVTPGTATVFATLTADKKTLTLVFRTTTTLASNDTVQLKSSKSLRNDYDVQNKITGSALKALAN